MKLTLLHPLQLVWLSRKEDLAVQSPQRLLRLYVIITAVSLENILKDWGGNSPV
jgi:hypothetical protein